MTALHRHHFSTAGLLVAATLVSCGGLLGFEDSTRRGDEVGGEGGAGGGDDTGGTTSGGAANGGASGAGVSGDGGAAGIGASGEGGGGAGAGSGTGGAGAGGASGSAGSGAGGATGGAGQARPGEDCDNRIERVCSANLVLRCEADVWVVEALCREAHGCHPVALVCAEFAPDCVDHPEGLCYGTSLVDCRSNPFTPPDQVCPFGCANGACLPGRGDQLIVHTEPHPDRGEPWPGDLSIEIPVCFASDPGENVKLWIRSAVDQGWTRYVDVEFTGWEDCEDNVVPEVILEFPEDCRGRLASPVPARTSADVLAGLDQRVGICRSYFDASDQPQPQQLGDEPEDEELVRFVARHQFGHVLGLGEAGLGSSSTVMVRSVRSAHIDSTVWAEDIRPFWQSYGYTPERAIVSASGSCLEAQGNVVLSNCWGSAHQGFRALPDRIEVLDQEEECLVASGDPPVASRGSCSSISAANAFALRRARWSAPGHCVAPREFPAVPGTLLVTKPCTEIGEASQTWDFEIVGFNSWGRPHARIRLVAQDYCVSVVEHFGGFGDVPILEPCASTDSVFALGPDGNVARPVPGSSNESPYCLDWYGSSVIHFRECNGQPFMLTGTLETPSGLALSTNPDDPNAGVSVVELGPTDAPLAGQVFDVHF